jgi:hypothetical protein
MGPNIRALCKTGEGKINAKIDQSVVGKHKGGNGGIFGVEGVCRHQPKQGCGVFW